MMGSMDAAVEGRAVMDGIVAGGGPVVVGAGGSLLPCAAGKPVGRKPGGSPACG